MPAQVFTVAVYIQPKRKHQQHQQQSTKSYTKDHTSDSTVSWTSRHHVSNQHFTVLCQHILVCQCCSQYTKRKHDTAHQKVLILEHKLAIAMFRFDSVQLNIAPGIVPTDRALTTAPSITVDYATIATATAVAKHL
eukprot:2051-Heterococcus_DN1.PRE.1